MIKEFLIVALVGTLSILPFIVDNTDFEPWQEDDTFIVAPEGALRKLSRSDPNWVPQSELEAYHQGLYEAEEASRKEKLKDLFGATANVCLNGKDRTKLTLQENINEFIKGPCSPVIMVPGIVGTSLQVEVDCERLQAYSPDIFENCGWKTCNSAQFWLKKPHTEYRLWIGSTTSPMAVIMTSKKAKCFGDMIYLRYDSSHPDPKQRYASPPGIKITYHGNTPESKQDGECGLHAIYDVSDDIIVKAAMCDATAYKSIGDELKNMGYISGLTMQAIPYDFRLSIAASETQAYMKKSLDNLHSLTGKKTYIVGHSLGTLHSTNLMYEFPQEEKDKLVAGIFAMGGPLLGATKIWKSTLGGDDSFLVNLFVVDAGVNWYSQNKMSHTSSSLVDLYTRDTFIRHREAPWMKEIFSRMALEAEYKKTGVFPETNVPLSWFPTPKNTCGAGFEVRTDECQLLMQDLAEPFLFVQGRSYDASEASTKQALKDNLPLDQATQVIQFYEECRRPKADELLHPGVPMIVLYGAHSSVYFKFTYDQSPREVTAERQDFYFPDHTELSVGDSTVLSSSAMTPAIKWIYDHNQGSTKFPTKLVEYCSEFSGDNSSIYDTTKDGEKLFTKSGYLGLKCQCRNGEVKMDKCSHACMINDPKLVAFLADIVQNNAKSTITTTTKSEAELQAFLDGCQNLH